MPTRKTFLAGLIRGLVLTLSILMLCALVGAQVQPASAAGASALVRVIHASPDAGTVDLFVDGKKVLSNFQFATITGYTPVAVGQHKIQIAAIGTGPNAAVLTEMLSFEANTTYTVAGLGTKQAGFSFQSFVDNNSISGNDAAKVRVYHLSPGSGTLSVATNGQTLIDNLAYAQASQYQTLSAGSYTFNVTATQNNTTLPVTAQLKSGTVTSLFAVGMLNGNPKFQFIDAQVPGMPGMPGTGSDPNALPTSVSTPSPLSSWVWGTMAVLLASGVGLTMGLRKKVHGIK